MLCSDLDRFETVLPEEMKKDGHVDPQIRQTLVRYFAGPLSNVSTPQDAMTVLGMAVTTFTRKRGASTKTRRVFCWVV